MKLLFKYLFFICAYACAIQSASSQTLYTVTTVPPLTGGNSQSGVTFNVKAYQSVVLKELWVSFASTGTFSATVMYKTDSINGAPTVNTANGWNTALSSVSTTVTSSGAGNLTKIPMDLNLTIPAGQTWGFHVGLASGSVTYTTYVSSNQTLFSDGTLHINTGPNVGYGGAAPSPTFSTRQFNGKIVYYLACGTPANLNAAAVLTTSATFTWSPVSGSIGYEYAMTSTPTPPASGTPTTAVSRTQTGLTPGTTYYFHVRNKCSSTAYSGWATKQITTLVCSNIDTIRPGNITDNSAIITWNNKASASSYEYILSTDPTMPAVTDVGTSVNSTFATLSGLQENTTYHFFLRGVCPSISAVSDWTNASFTTRFTCKPPDVTVTPQQASAEVSWDKILFSAGYEYAVTKSPTPPSLGKTIFTEQVNVPLPEDGSGAYFHIRTKCYDIFTTSPWGTTELQAPTAVLNVNKGASLLNVFPNPVQNRLVIEIPNAKGGVITITDVTGKLVYSTQVIAAGMEVDMASYPKGLYLVKYTGSGTTQIVKVAKE